MRSLVVLLAVCLPATFARAQEDPAAPARHPVSPELLRGHTLYLESVNCTVDAPTGFDWQASPEMSEKHPEVQMFLCKDPRESRIFMLQVYTQGFATLDEKGMDDFLGGAKGSMEKQGWKFLATSKERTAFPVEESSFRFSVKLLRTKDNVEIYWVGYVATAQHMYCLSSMQLESGERAEFHSFVRSFKLLHPLSFLWKVWPFLPYLVLSMFVGTVVVFITNRKSRVENEKPAAADDADPDESSETDAFKPKPILPSKEKSRKEEKKTAGVTRRDAERPEKPSRGTSKAKPDEESGKKSKPRRDERPDRPRKDERPFG
jgi:hypothetical protein